MRRPTVAGAALVGGFAFLYAPILLLVATSFNESRLTTVWTGVSLRWFAALADDDELMQAAWLSLRIASASASVAACIGGLAGWALARLGPFRSRPLYAGLLAAPLVLPDLLIALAMLLLLVAVEGVAGWPERGAVTVVLAHATASLAYVAVVVQARLAGLATDLEDAAMDLGATPIVAFWRVTLPLMMPALAAGWLLAFTLSLDDVVIASFVSGPGATTLPMLVFSRLHLGTTPELNALATVVLACVIVALAIVHFARRRVARRAR